MPRAGSDAERDLGLFGFLGKEADAFPLLLIIPFGIEIER
jgi:hypothetical protein